MMNLKDIPIDEILERDKKNEVALPEELCFMNRMKKGNISLACAKTGVGKSLFLRQFGCCVASSGKKVLYISLENDEATDMEHFKFLRELYNPEEFYYFRGEPWISSTCKKEEFKGFDVVCIDGLETTIDIDANESSFEIYRRVVMKIKTFFSDACVWLSWQMGRQFATEEPTIEDIAFSYAAARLAYSAVAIYWKNDVRYIKNIKGRGGNVKMEGVLEWGKRFDLSGGFELRPEAIEEEKNNPFKMGEDNYGTNKKSVHSYAAGNERYFKHRK